MIVMIIVITILFLTVISFLKLSFLNLIFFVITATSSSNMAVMLCGACQPDTKGRVNSLVTVLLQEVDRFNKLLVVIKVSLL